MSYNLHIVGFNFQKRFEHELKYKNKFYTYLILSYEILESLFYNMHAHQYDFYNNDTYFLGFHTININPLCYTIPTTLKKHKNIHKIFQKKQRMINFFAII